MGTAILPAERRAGRPRDEAAGAVILDATLRLLAERGYHGMSTAAVAAAARASKATVYRRWPSKFALVAAAIERGLQQAAGGAGRTGDLRADFVAVLGAKMQALGAGPLGPAIRAVVSEAAYEPELSAAMRRVTDMIRERGPLRRLVEEAMDQGLVARDADIALLLDLLLGPPFFQLLVLQTPPDPRQAPALVDQVLGPAKPNRSAS